jgi:hypothetical protein
MSGTDDHCARSLQPCIGTVRIMIPVPQGAMPSPMLNLNNEPAVRLQHTPEPGTPRGHSPYRLPDPTPPRPEPAFVAVSGQGRTSNPPTLPPYIAHIGDIGITQTLVVTPSGTCARFRTTWTVTDSTSYGAAEHPSNDGSSGDNTGEHRRFNAAMRAARIHLRRGPVRWLDVLVEGGGIRHLTRVTIESAEHESQIRSVIAAVEQSAMRTPERNPRQPDPPTVPGRE